MRKRFWAGIALMIFTAAGVWLYATRSSEATLVACVVKPVGQTAAVNTAPLPSAPGPRARAPVFEPLPTPADADAIEPIVVEMRDEQRVRPPFRIGGILDVAEGEACEAILSTPLEAPPAYMPYADEPIAAAPLTGAIGSAPAACRTSWGWLGCCDEAPCGACDCCAWIMDLVNKFAAALCPHAPAIEGPPVDPEAQEPPVDLRDRLGLPSMREDPNYHYHYPSCPYPGNCPYPYHYQLPPVQPVRPVQPQRASPPERDRPHRQISYFTPDMEGAGVDTMECRPSDLPHLGRNRPF